MKGRLAKAAIHAAFPQFLDAEVEVLAQKRDEFLRRNLARAVGVLEIPGDVPQHSVASRHHSPPLRFGAPFGSSGCCGLSFPSATSFAASSESRTSTSSPSTTFPIPG